MECDNVGLFFFSLYKLPYGYKTLDSINTMGKQYLIVVIVQNDHHFGADHGSLISEFWRKKKNNHPSDQKINQCIESIFHFRISEPLDPH